MENKEAENHTLNRLKEIDITFNKLLNEAVDLKSHTIKSSIPKINEKLDEILEKILSIFHKTNYQSSILEKENQLHNKIDSMKREMRELFIQHNSKLLNKMDEHTEAIKNFTTGSQISEEESKQRTPILSKGIGLIEEIAEEPEEFPLRADYLLETSNLSPHFLPGKNTVIEYAGEKDFLVVQTDNCYTMYKDGTFLTTFKNSQNKSKKDSLNFFIYYLRKLKIKY